ncbi:unnamed protein product [Soboliphyme baturini]|uniref:Alpha-1,3/1,6-mannosyltransferase ALG2 n=1 Tax=Soboliphyme baturini TaxID=241478 RepID=A0A183J6V4_9BILA|nr:unnamed protein product [Soboliphyme baturini]
MDKRKWKVSFLHPDLGIGGAERFVVDAAKVLKRSGHDVQFFTCHHDPTHCFPETVDGQLPVIVVGDWLPTSLFGRCRALCTYIRMLWLTVYFIVCARPSCDLVFLDQVSVGIPLLRLKKGCKVIFYCHFPDQRLTSRSSLLKSIYRFPIDWLEEWSTGLADQVLVNSHFTGNTIAYGLQVESAVGLYGHVMTISQERLAKPAILAKPQRIGPRARAWL